MVDAIIEKQRPGQCSVLVYTSGTTGNPKGVMLSHDNMIFNCEVLMRRIEETTPVELFPTDFSEIKIVSFLPLSHIAGLQADLIGNCCFGSQLFFAKPDALQGTLVETLTWARPNIFMAVPRVWEKFEDKLKEIASTKPAFLQSISGWAKGYGAQKVMDQQKG